MNSLPKVGFGTWQLDEGREAETAVRTALKVGYRLIDTAKIYGNEQSVGRAIKGCGIPREQIFLTTKLWPADFYQASQAFGDSLRRLGLDYVDLYLIHWPSSDGRGRQQAWQSLEEIQRSGRARHIGVSNFDVEQLEELLSYAQLKPAVNQIEFHPFIYQQQRPTLEFCHQQNIAVEAYSPLSKGRQLGQKIIKTIAEDLSKTPAQVMIRWALQHATTPIPRSSNPDHIKDNYQVFDFELSVAEMERLDGLSG